MKSHFQDHGWRVAVGAFLAVAALLAAPVMPVLAQSARQDAARQADRIDRLQAEQERLREARSLGSMTRAPAGEAASAPLPVSSRPDETCIAVDRITVSGTTLLRAVEVGQVTARWEGQCLGLAELNSLLEALTFLYVERGYIASRAYLPEQDLSDGSLDISIIEGNLEGISRNGEMTAGSAQLTRPPMRQEKHPARQLLSIGRGMLWLSTGPLTKN